MEMGKATFQPWKSWMQHNSHVQVRQSLAQSLGNVSFPLLPGFTRPLDPGYHHETKGPRLLRRFPVRMEHGTPGMPRMKGFINSAFELFFLSKHGDKKLQMIGNSAKGLHNLR